MNKQKPENPNHIGWTRRRVLTGDGEYVRLDGFSWNPIVGCEHNCTWMMKGRHIQCYAKELVEGRMKELYPAGFQAHYFLEDRLDQPRRVSQPSGIFMSMSDPFGHWVPDEHLWAIFKVMRETPWHTYMLLTKFPRRFQDFPDMPKNLWVGNSIPATWMMKTVMEYPSDDRVFPASNFLKKMLSQVHMYVNPENNLRFLSAEPLWFDIVPALEWWENKHQRVIPYDWIIVGAGSIGPEKIQPHPGIVTRLRLFAHARGIPLYYKENMRVDDPLEQFPRENEVFSQIRRKPKKQGRQLSLFPK